MKRVLRIAIRIVVLVVVIQVAYTCVDGLSDYKGKADIAIVLGNRVDPDSSLSPVLKGRVDKALKLYRQGRVGRIMVSGGMGMTDGMGGVPEGMAMKLYLLHQGVPADRIIEDNHGENTYLTAKDFLPVADSLHIQSAIAVSSFYHITRTKYIIRHLGFKNIHGASSDDYFANDLIGLARDCVAIYKYIAKY